MRVEPTRHPSKEPYPSGSKQTEEIFNEVKRVEANVDETASTPVLVDGGEDGGEVEEPVQQEADTDPQPADDQACEPETGEGGLRPRDGGEEIYILLYSMYIKYNVCYGERVDDLF